MLLALSAHQCGQWKTPCFFHQPVRGAAVGTAAAKRNGNPVDLGLACCPYSLVRPSPSLLFSNILCRNKIPNFKEIKMFKKFEEKESVSGIQQLKSSVQKGIRTKLLEQYPHLEAYVDSILPKKDTYRIVKCHDHIEILVNTAGELLFFRHRDGSWIPTLRLLHKYPFLLPWEQVDKGAIRFVLSGANIMCPGLTSPGAKMTPVPQGTVVAIMAEGKQHALAVGSTALSTEDIAKINKGIGVENCHYLNDGLWQMKPIK